MHKIGEDGALNLTILECKFIVRLEDYMVNSTLNLTILECKLKPTFCILKDYCALNLTILECKYGFPVTTETKRTVL